MTRKEKIRKLLERLNKLQSERLPLPAYIDRQMAEENARERVDRETSPTALALRRLGADLYKIQRSPHVKNLFKLRKRDLAETDEKISAISASFSEKLASIEQELMTAVSRGTATEQFLADFAVRLDSLTAEFDAERAEGAAKTNLLAERAEQIASTLSSVEEGANQALLETAAEVVIATETAQNALQKAEDATKTSESTRRAVESLQNELPRRFSQAIQRNGNGNANRDITIGGNPSTLQYYTDINLKAGSNVTITYAPNHVTQRTDVTFSSSGGGGSVGGVTRSIETVNTSQTAGDTEGTDYVYLCSAGINLTLPTAVTNENLYTIKNIGNSSVLVSPQGGQTIENDSNLILVVQYTSVDLISDGASNWNIT